MKKRSTKTAVAAVFAAAIFSTVLPVTYAAEPPTITLNGDTTEIAIRYIDGDLYFSISDFWEQVLSIPAENIKWYEDEQILFNGSIFLSVEDQQWYRRSDKTNRFSNPVIYEDGVVWTQPSILKDMNISTTYEKDGNTLNFKQTYWEFPNGRQFDYWLSLIPLDKETGRPDFNSVEQVRTKGPFSEKHFHILSQELGNGKTVYAYISKVSPQNFILVTCADGYVAHVLDNNGVFTYNDYGLRTSE